MQQTTVIEISVKSIIRIVAVILGIILVWMVSDILFSIVVALIVASAIEPWVGKLQTKGVPRSISVLLTYLVALGIVALAIGSIIPPLASEVSQLVKDFPEKYKGFREIFRMRIKQLGLCLLQESVYVSPYPCFDEIEFLRQLYKIPFQVRYIVASKIEDDGELRTQFGLSD